MFGFGPVAFKKGPKHGGKKHNKKRGRKR